MRSTCLQPLRKPRMVLRLVSRSATPVVAAAEASEPSEKKVLTKASKFKGMSQEQIDGEVQKAKRALFDLRIAQRTKQVSRHNRSGTLSLCGPLPVSSSVTSVCCQSTPSEPQFHQAVLLL